MGFHIIYFGMLLITSKPFFFLFGLLGSSILQLYNRNMDQFECEKRVEAYIRNHEKLFLSLWWIGWTAILIGAIVQYSWAGIFFPGVLWLIVWILSKILRVIMKQQETKQRKAHQQASTATKVPDNVAPKEPKASQPFSMKSDLRFLVIADCHSLTEEEAARLADLEYDLCFLLGDINEKYLKLILQHIPLEKTCGIHGNHDEPGLLESLSVPNIHLKTIKHNGITILGYEGSPRYKRGAYVMHTQEESQQDFKQAPPADILVSHDGPYMLCSENLSHSGFLGITEYLTAHAVPLNIHGHQHTNSHKRHGTTDIICIYRAALINLGDSTIHQMF